MTDGSLQAVPNGRNFRVMNIQTVVSLVSTIVLCRWFFPDILVADFATAVLPVATLHMFRFLGMTMLMPGQVDERISEAAKKRVAYLDLAVAVSAVVLTVAIVEGFQEPTIRIFDWIFILVCFVDLAIVQRFFVAERFWDKSMGVFWLFQALLSGPMILGELLVLYRMIVG